MSEDIIRKFTAYSQAKQTLPKTRQIVMLYDGMVRFMKQAKEAIISGDIEERYNSVTKVSQIITGLHSSIDWDRGGEIARILDGFYSSIFADLNEIQRTGSIQKCDHVIKELSEMLSSWTQIDMNTGVQSEDSQVVVTKQKIQDDTPDMGGKIAMSSSDELSFSGLSV